MEKTFTLTDLLLFIKEEEKAIEHAKHDLYGDSPDAVPRSITINNVLSYSKALQIYPSKNLEPIEIILN